MGDATVYLNDPVTPDLVKTVPIPPQDPLLPISVRNFVDTSVPQDTPQGRAVQCQVTIGMALRRFQALRPDKSPVRWPAVQVLQVEPEKGQKFNAYYDRRALNFFFDIDPVRKKMVYASSSADIINHELGHALLDSLHPGLWGYSGLFEVWALHESFGDINTLVMSAGHEELVHRAWVRTNGDLTKTNILSRIADQFGMAIKKTPDKPPVGLRDASAGFVYKDPATLPSEGPRDRLVREVHSFSRVFTCATYHLFVLIQDKLHKQGADPVAAAMEAMDYIGLLVYGAAPLVAVRPDFYDSFARCMLYIDFTQGQKHAPEITAAYRNHQVLKPENNQVKLMALGEPRHDPANVTTDETGGRRELFKVRTSVCPAREMGRLMSPRRPNPLFGLEVEVGLDRVRRFDARGRLVEDRMPSREDALKSVTLTLDYLHENRLVGVDEHQPFGIEENRLVRKHFACGHNH